MLIDIKKIHPNPYRDFNLYPFDEEQIEGLMRSFEDNGDFGALPARPNGSANSFQIAAGHHRLEAMRRLGFEHADLKIEDRDDDQMIRIMVDENAKQMGQNAAAVLDSVSAAIRRIAYVTLTGEWEGITQEFLRYVYVDEDGRPSKKAFEIARGKIESGQGVGHITIERYLDNRLSVAKIQSALATIKASELHSALVDKVREKIDAERRESERLADEARQEAERIARSRAEAEEAARKEAEAWKRKLEKMERDKAAAQKAANDAKLKRDREIAEQRQRELEARQREETERHKAQQELRRKREAEAAKEAAAMAARRTQADALVKQKTNASTRAEKASVAVEEKAKGEVLFDAKISQIFKNDYQLGEFRKAVTTGNLARILPTNRQYACAEACKAWHERNKVELTAKSINDWLAREMQDFLRQETKVSKREQEIALRESLDRQILWEWDNLRDALVKIRTSSDRLKKHYDSYPEDGRAPVKLEVSRLIPSAVSDLEKLRERLIKIGSR